MRRSSLPIKVYLSLSIIFVLVLIVAVSIAANSERSLSQEMIEQQLQDKADAYLDALNIMMLTGTIANRDIVKEKIESDINVTSARVLRSKHIDKIYGKGLTHEYPQDEFDHRALAGESILYEQDSDEHTLTYIQPIIAKENYRGTNCLTCHQVSEGTQLGAVRIDYSLAQIDKKIQGHILTMALAQGLMLILALFVIAFLMRKFIIKPIKRMHKAIKNIEKNSDLSQQVAIESYDEIGAMGLAFNRMLIQFKGSMTEVVTSSEHLSSAATSIETSSQNSLQAAINQRNETGEINRAIEQLQDSISSVSNNAQQSSQASQTALTTSHQGQVKTEQAIAGISTMTEAIDQAVVVINNLDERSTNVGSVLDVIKGIAEQTNLLALNAAIEAARAGESGRGFAVVADEVRSLSLKTHESTQEIERMIAQLQEEAQGAVGAMSTAQNKAKEGVEQVQQAAEALNHMSSQVKSMDELNRLTLVTIEQQTEIGQQVQTSLVEITSHADNSTECSQDTASISNQLVNLSAALNQLVNRFKL